MNFMGLLKSLDEFLYEVVSWLVFYPMTLWRVLRRPLRMMDYSDRELRQADVEQYTDTLRPPLFLLVSLLLSHALELAVVGSSAIVESKRGLAALVNDDTSLVLLRLVIFSVPPLIFAARLTRLQGQGITRKSLKQPFYAQCYASAPFALGLGIGGMLTHTHWSWGVPVGLGVMLLTLFGYWIVQARWFAQHLRRPLLAGLGHAAVGLIETFIVILLVAPLFA